jgi:hypothetical protein
MNLLLILLTFIQPTRHNVLHQCVTMNTAEYQCVFKVYDSFYLCGGDYGIVNECIINLEKKYDTLRFNYVPYTLLWSPNIPHQPYSQFPQRIETPKYFQRIYEPI